MNKPPFPSEQELIELGGAVLSDHRPAAQCYVARFFRENGEAAWVAFQFDRRHRVMLN
jgi:hypothetical protein